MEVVALVAVIAGGSALFWGLFAWSWRRHFRHGAPTRHN